MNGMNVSIKCSIKTNDVRKTTVLNKDIECLIF